MAGLKSSRWAPRDHGDARDARASSMPAPTARNHAHAVGRTMPGNGASSCARQSAIDAGSAAAELSRYSKIVRRMKWKLPFLDVGYRQAMSEHETDEARRAESELMFKLDFFDYYMLCERALVHLQGVFGITILRDGTAAPGRKGATHTQQHRYHANVLAALDREDNPLHSVLGVGDVRRHLARAKDLRNHWKNADDEDDDGGGDGDGDDNAAGTAAAGAKTRSRRRTRPVPLVDYDLAAILASIHQGLDRAYVVASEFAASRAEEEKRSGADTTRTDRMAMDMDPDDDDGWGFIVDAMDWEAV